MYRLLMIQWFELVPPPLVSPLDPGSVMGVHQNTGEYNRGFRLQERRVNSGVFPSLRALAKDAKSRIFLLETAFEL